MISKVSIRILGVICLAMFSSTSSSYALAQNSDRAANVVKAAVEIGFIQRRGGANAAFGAIKQCYDRELEVANSLTQGVETCITQDLLVSQMTAAFYRGISAEGRKKAGVAEPEEIQKVVTLRVLAIFKNNQEIWSLFGGSEELQSACKYQRL
jgi:hypothetical protein